MLCMRNLIRVPSITYKHLGTLAWLVVHLMFAHNLHCSSHKQTRKRLAGGESLPEIKFENNAGGGGLQYLLTDYQQHPEIPAAAAMEMKTVTGDDFTAKFKDNEGSSAWDFPQFVSDFKRQHLPQSEQFKAELNRQVESKVSAMKMQHEKAMAEERRRSEELAKLLKKAVEEKENFEKLAGQLSVIVTAMKHVLKQGMQNYITCSSSSANEDLIVGEEVASNFRRKTRDEDSEAEPAAKRRKLGGRKK